MARQIEYPDVDDLGRGAIELSSQEFEEFLNALAESGTDEGLIALVKRAGFYALLNRQEFE